MLLGLLLVCTCVSLCGLAVGSSPSFYSEARLLAFRLFFQDLGFLGLLWCQMGYLCVGFRVAGGFRVARERVEAQVLFSPGFEFRDLPSVSLDVLWDGMSKSKP